MKSMQRVTQNDVARAAGVNRATVSLALRRMPGIPLSTCKRIERIAARLGYRPDPMLAALASYRNRLRPQSYHGTLLWLAETLPELQWRKIRHFTDYLAGAEAGAVRHGYQIEVIDITEAKVTWQRAGAIARARGVKGLLLAPQPRSNSHLDLFPWEDFSSVTFGYTLSRPALHSVTSAHYRAMMTVVRELSLRGYRRIGCALRPEHDRRLDRNFLGAYLAGCALAGQAPLPVCPDDAEQSDGEALLAWLRETKPDAVISGNVAMLDVLKRAGIAVPRQLGVACPNLGTTDGDLAGVVERNRHIGEVAVDHLVALIHRGERGVPDVPQRTLVDGVWHAGRSVRRRVRAAGVGLG